LDLCHIDEAGFAPTLPTCYSWYPVGERLLVPYEAPQGRRVNALGAYFSHGPLAGEFQFETFARLPVRRPKKGKPGKPPRKTLAQRALEHGLWPAEVGVIDKGVFLSFLWKVAGRPTPAPEGWRRERPLMVVIDNYSVHTSDVVQAALPELAAADVHLFYLPAYSPELSAIEPIWQDVKHHEIPERSHPRLGGLKRAVDAALRRKADRLQRLPVETENLFRQAA
jgi:hypothetical protein